MIIQERICRTLIMQNGKGSCNGKSMQNINHAYASMDRKRLMMNEDTDVLHQQTV